MISNYNYKEILRSNNLMSTYKWYVRENPLHYKGKIKTFLIKPEQISQTVSDLEIWLDKPVDILKNRRLRVLTKRLMKNMGLVNTRKYKDIDYNQLRWLMCVGGWLQDRIT